MATYSRSDRFDEIIRCERQVASYYHQLGVEDIDHVGHILAQFVA